MKPLKLLGTSALVAAVLVTSMPAMAQTSATPQKKITAPASPSFYAEQMKEASMMMGQVGLARDALNIGMNEEAANHITKARQLAATLEEKAPELSVASTLRAGGKVYTFNNEYKDYLIPVVDDLFTTDDYDILVKPNPSNDKVAEKVAEVGRYRLTLDIRNVAKALDQAHSYALDGKIMEARIALNNMFLGAFETAVAYEDPIWSVHDNLMASYAMILNKDYAGARFALKDAGKALKTIEKSGNYAANSETIKRLEQEVSALHESLKIKNPPLIQKAEKTISGWLKDIRQIGHQNAG